MQNQYLRIRFSEEVWESRMQYSLMRQVLYVRAQWSLQQQLTRTHLCSFKKTLKNGTHASIMQSRRGKIIKRSTIRRKNLLLLLLTPISRTQVLNIRQLAFIRMLDSSILWNWKLQCIPILGQMILSIKELWKEGRAVNRFMHQQ